MFCLRMKFRKIEYLFQNNLTTNIKEENCVNKSFKILVCGSFNTRLFITFGVNKGTTRTACMVCGLDGY